MGGRGEVAKGRGLVAGHHPLNWTRRQRRWPSKSSSIPASGSLDDGDNPLLLSRQRSPPPTPPTPHSAADQSSLDPIKRRQSSLEPSRAELARLSFQSRAELPPIYFGVPLSYSWVADHSPDKKTPTAFRFFSLLSHSVSAQRSLIRDRTSSVPAAVAGSKSKSPTAMDLSPFEKDIDELIDEFSQGESTSFAEMKRVWASRKFTYIYEAAPTPSPYSSSNLAFFMQSLFAHSLGELKNIKDLIVASKERGITVVPPLVKRMLERNMFLFGALDVNEASVLERVNQLMELQNARVELAYKKLFANTRIEHFLHMDLGVEIDMDIIKKMSSEYAEAKKLAIQEARTEVDVQNIEHIIEDKKSIGDVVEGIADEWNTERKAFYQQTGLSLQHSSEEGHLLQPPPEREDDEDFEHKLEEILSEPN
ncbi:hypothetical protein CRG98_018016 [Punica granatum]|uniref:Uncharacterized protein n=1 Tax=Punica granatum TaxID=22663 RepID=A0A2I0JZ34_PUNGR|nr:hypothetical protein CRG98_018016 [Punica granatum]